MLMRRSPWRCCFISEAMDQSGIGTCDFAQPSPAQLTCTCITDRDDGPFLPFSCSPFLIHSCNGVYLDLPSRMNIFALSIPTEMSFFVCEP